jgi:hypothetical protein
MEITKTKPFDLEAIKNGAKWGIIKSIENKPLILYNNHMTEFSEIIYSSSNKKGLQLLWGSTLYKVEYDGRLFKFNYSQETLFTDYKIVLLQEPKLASDLSEVKVGDKVWDFRFGWGKIVSSSVTSLRYPIAVCFNNLKETFYYTLEGKPLTNLNINQTLFLTEIKFKIPEV